jgi:hypothetical protein
MEPPTLIILRIIIIIMNIFKAHESNKISLGTAQKTCIHTYMKPRGKNIAY